MLTREQILQANKLKRETVNVPEWGGDVVVQEMTVGDRDRLETSGMGRRGMQNLRCRMIAMSVIDESGKRLFSDADMAAIGGLSASAAEKLLAAIVSINAMSPQDIKELEGNSEAA